MGINTNNFIYDFQSVLARHNVAYVEVNGKKVVQVQADGGLRIEADNVKIVPFNTEPEDKGPKFRIVNKDS